MYMTKVFKLKQIMTYDVVDEVDGNADDQTYQININPRCGIFGEFRVSTTYECI